MADNNLAAGITSVGTYSVDALYAGDTMPRVKRVVTLTGGPYVRGTLLGVVTASGKYPRSASAAGDGSEAPEAILDQDADGSAADVKALICETGEFNEGAVVLGAGHTIASVRKTLRGLGIFLRKVVAA